MPPDKSLKISDCPICGIHPQIVDFFNLYQIRCPECNYHSSYYEHVEDAIENFNDISSRTRGERNDQRVS